MANEIDPEEKRAKARVYEATRKRLRRIGSTDSVAEAVANGTVPPSRNDFVLGGTPIGPAPGKMIQLIKSLDKGEFGPGWEAMNDRQMALGQKLQWLAHEVLSDPDWLERFKEHATPADLKAYIDIGIKIERQAMMGILESAKKKEDEKGKAGESSGLVHKALKSPVLVDAMHDLFDDDAEDSDED